MSRLTSPQYEAKRNLLCDALRQMGYDAPRPQGSFYCFPRTPIPDDLAFIHLLQNEGILAVPGRVSDAPAICASPSPSAATNSNARSPASSARSRKVRRTRDRLSHSPSLLIAAAAAQTDPSGHWEGTLGQWTGSLGMPQQKVAAVRATGIRIVDATVQFTAPGLPGIPAFDLTWSPGKLSGKLDVKGAALPLEMKRTGDAKVEAAQSSPAVSRELEGDWQGSVTMPSGQSRDVAVHFKNQPDKPWLQPSTARVMAWKGSNSPASAIPAASSSLPSQSGPPPAATKAPSTRKAPN